MKDRRMVFRRLKLINSVLKGSYPKLTSAEVGSLALKENGLVVSGEYVLPDNALRSLEEDMEYRLLEAKARNRFEERLLTVGISYKFFRERMRVEGMYFNYKDQLDEVEPYIAEIADMIAELGGAETKFSKFVDAATENSNVDEEKQTVESVSDSNPKPSSGADYDDVCAYRTVAPSQN